MKSRDIAVSEQVWANKTYEQRELSEIIYQFCMNVRRVFLRVGRMGLRRLCVQRSQVDNQEYGEVSEFEVMMSWM
jgi:hypothetical protein